MFSAVSPCASICFGVRYRLAIPSFSSSVYPDSEITSMRSSSAPGIVSSVFAVQMNSTFDKSNGRSR